MIRDYVKVIEWSHEDDCFVGSAPPLVGRSCHGATERTVLKQLTVIMQEVLDLHKTDGTIPAPGTAGKE